MYLRDLNDVREFLKHHIGDSLNKTLLCPVEIKSPNGEVVSVTYIARNSVNGRIRLFEQPGSQPMELSHCSGVVAAFRDYSDVVRDRERFEANKKLMADLSHFVGMDPLAVLTKCGFPITEKDKIQSENLVKILNGEMVNLYEEKTEALKTLLDFAKSIERDEEYYNLFHDVKPEDLAKFEPIVRARYWWYRGMQNRSTVAWTMRDMWHSAYQFGETCPVFYDVWVRDEKDMKEVSDYLISAGFTTIKFIDNSSACLSHIRMLSELGWKISGLAKVNYEDNRTIGYDGLEFVYNIKE